MADTPYSKLEARAFWRSGVADRAAFEITELYRPKFLIHNRQKVMTAGSCFAFHIGRALRSANFNVLDAEALPKDVPDEVALALGYRQYSARYGNIYTAAQLLQLVQEAEGILQPAEPVWEKDGMFYDAQRPAVDQDGFDSPEAVLESRKFHLQAVCELIRQAGVFVFTFGLTETWAHKQTGTGYPTAPGVIAGQYDPAVYQFENHDAARVLGDFLAFREHVKTVNPRLKFIVTVSPVPLTATASGHHVEVASTYSKSVLRAVAGQLEATYDDVDYFPSYEIVTSVTNRGAYFDTNLRSVTAAGVSAAMACFLKAHGASDEGAQGIDEDAKQDDAACEEALLDAFAP